MISNVKLGVLPPGEHRFILADIRELPETDSLISVEISFKDGLGRSCKRSATGKLSTSKKFT